MVKHKLEKSTYHVTHIVFCVRIGPALQQNTHTVAVTFESGANQSSASSALRWENIVSVKKLMSASSKLFENNQTKSSGQKRKHAIIEFMMQRAHEKNGLTYNWDVHA